MGLMILRTNYTKSEGYRGNLEDSARSFPAKPGSEKWPDEVQDRTGDMI